jgi:hypothetical protein
MVSHLLAGDAKTVLSRSSSSFSSADLRISQTPYAVV